MYIIFQYQKQSLHAYHKSCSVAINSKSSNCSSNTEDTTSWYISIRWTPIFVDFIVKLKLLWWCIYLLCVYVGVLPAEQLPGDPVAPPPHGTRRLEAGVWLQNHLCSGPQWLKVLQGKFSLFARVGNKTCQLLFQKWEHLLSVCSIIGY